MFAILILYISKALVSIEIVIPFSLNAPCIRRQNAVPIFVISP